MSALPLRIDIVSDVVCPWCIIGYLQLQKALQQHEDQLDVELHWQPFELNPWMPAEGQDIREHMKEKYGASASQSRGSRARLQEMGEALGFEFNFADDARIVNTFLAHQLLHWAGTLDADTPTTPTTPTRSREPSIQTQLKLALFKAYFSDGKDVSQIDVLVDVACSLGLSAEQARQALDGRYNDAVRTEQQEWLERDVHAVPAFSFDQQYAVPGAQGEETFSRYIKKIISRSSAS